MFLELPHFGASLPQSGLQLPDSCAMQFGPQFPDSCAIQFDSPLQEIISMRSDSYVQALNTSFEGLSALVERWKESFDGDTQLEPSIAVPEDTMQAIRELEPLVPEEQREKFEDIIAPPKEGKGKILTAKNVKWLIGIFLQIFILIQGYTSGIQEQTAIEQTDIQIEIAEEQCDLDRRKTKALEQISGTFQRFVDVLEIFYTASIEIEDQVDVFGNHGYQSDQSTISDAPCEDQQASNAMQNLQD